MAKTFTAAFAQTPKTSSVVSTVASTGIDTLSPTGLFLCTAGAEGAIVTSLKAIPRSTCSKTRLYLWKTANGSSDKYMIGSVSLAAYTTSSTDAPVQADFGFTEETPLRLAAGDSLYAGIALDTNGGIVFNAQYTDF